MNVTPNWLRPVLHFIWIMLLAVVVSTLLQSQINLLALQQLGVSISAAERLATSWHDIVHFSPLYLLLFGVSFLLSQSIAAVFTVVLPTFSLGWQRILLFSVAGLVGLWCTLLLVNALAPMPTLIAASRSASGLAALLLVAAAAGALFAYCTTVKLSTAKDGGTTSEHASRLASLMMVSASISALLALALPGELAAAEPAEPARSYQVATLTAGLEHPWSLAFLPDGQYLVTERPGRLRLIAADGQLHPEPLAGLPAVFASGQAGLFDLLLSTDFASDQLIYFSYACGSSRANHTCLARGRLNVEQHRLEAVEELFRTQAAKTGNAHYGGRMVWLQDGSLLLSLGDGFDYREQAQQRSNHLGSIVRLQADGSVPDDNPFIHDPASKPEIFSYGHRNVQGLVVDAEQQLVYSHEHGPKGGDELNRIEAGSNYGWPIVSHGIDYTGARITPFTERAGMTPPLLQWTPSIAPSGMTLYRGALFPEWHNNLLIGALATKSVVRVSLDSGQAVQQEILFAELNERIRDVRTGPHGAVYLLTDQQNGRLLKVTP